MNQNLSVMGVASCRRTFLCLILRVHLVLSRFSVRDWSPCRASRIGSCVSRVSIREVARPNPTQPSTARPGPARPWRPHPPMRPLLLSLSHLDLPRNNLTLPLPPLSPCGALGIGDGDHRNLDPEVSSPPLPFSSLSLSRPVPSRRPPPLSPLRAAAPARPLTLPRRGGARPLPLPRAAALARPRPGLPRGDARPCPLPRGVVRPPLPPARPPRPPARPPQPSARPPWPRRGPCPRRAAPCARPRPPARGVPAPGVTRVASFTP
jgi:hypothetical protein